MLVGLRLENIALIDSLELSFEKGFNVFTGETGAGKSIFLVAIDFLLAGGQNGSLNKLIKPGSSKAFIEGIFKINNLIQEWLIENNFDEEIDELYITREMRLKEDKWFTRFRLNGLIINKQQLLDLKNYLIDFTIQGQSNQFSLSNNLVEWIDKFGDNSIQTTLIKVQESWRSWNIANKKFQEAKHNSETLKKEFEEINQFLIDLENANFNDASEFHKLTQAQDKLVHGVKLQEGLLRLFNYLKEVPGNDHNALQHLSLCIKEMKSLVLLDSSLSKQLDRFIDIYSELDQLIIALDEYYFTLESNPDQLQVVQERILLLKRLQNRYNLSLEEMVQKYNEYRETSDFNDQTIRLEKLKEEEEYLRKVRDQNNQILTNLRLDAAIKFKNILIKYLKSLALPNVQFEVLIQEGIPSEKGSDKLSFLFSANPGQPLAPLSEVASGGEMSRLLLALKTALAEVDGASTLIFDEIDSGVSGRVSSAIGKLLKQLSLHKQVFCVTHQPLVAALADHHFSVSKVFDKNTTHSSIKYLQNFDDRQKALAELAGGDSEEATIYAASLLENQAA